MCINCPCCSADLTRMNRIVGRRTASQIAVASAASSCRACRHLATFMSELRACALLGARTDGGSASKDAMASGRPLTQVGELGAAAAQVPSHSAVARKSRRLRVRRIPSVRKAARSRTYSHTSAPSRARSPINDYDCPCRAWALVCAGLSVESPCSWRGCFW